MKDNKEKSKFDRVRMIIGVVLSLIGLVALIFAGAASFTRLPLTFASILFILSGLFIAGSNRLALFIAELLS